MLWAALSACKKPMSQPTARMQYDQDFTTPQGAILCLEDAFRKRDIEAAVRCKHFPTEARLMLKKMGSGLESDAEIVTRTAEVLELSFRKHTEASWPDLSGVEVSFGSREPFGDGVEIVPETFVFPDGGTAVQRHYVTKTSEGWRVLNLAK